VYSILSPEWKLIRPAVEFFVDCSRACSSRFVQVGGASEEAGSGHEDSSHNILTLDCLAGLSQVVTPGLSMSMQLRPICKSTYLYTYLRSECSPEY
jgi:hypothetical protein